MLYKRGDVVKVWSLQSFDGGGFLKGKEGVVFQDQLPGEDSVLVTVKRRIDGQNKIDPNYEVYAEQLKLVRKADEKPCVDFRLNELIRYDFSKLSKSLESLAGDFKKLKEKMDMIIRD